MPGGVEDQVVEAGVGVLLDLLHGLVRVGGDDPALGDLLDRQFVGQAFHLGGGVHAVLLLGGQRQRCPEAAVLQRQFRVGIVGDLDLDHPVDVLEVAFGLVRAFLDRRDQLLGVEVHTLARGTDETITSATCVAGDHRATGSDVHRHRLLGNVIHVGALGVVVLALERHLLTGPQLPHQPDRFPQPREAFLELGPLPLKTGRVLVECLTGTDAEHDPPRIHTRHRGEGLRDDRRVVAERRRHHRGTDLHPLGTLTHRRHPRQRKRGMPTVVTPRLKMIGHRNRIHTVGLSRHRDLDKLTRIELLCRSLVSESQCHSDLLIVQLCPAQVFPVHHKPAPPRRPGGFSCAHIRLTSS